MKVFGPISPSNAPAVLTWKDLNVVTKIRRHNKTQKHLLNNLSGCIAGGLYGIMGASGSGKTTLLCVLSQRLDTTNMDLSGEIHLNGHAYSKSELKSMSGFVMQDDLLCATLTVEETLWYTASLRLPRTVTNEEKKIRIDEVLNMLGISYCRNVIIGDTRRKGISGGERKRVCVAMELLLKPKLLFLDEPTSGLDSTTALSLLTVLKSMSDRGDCTVVCTIHQPQTKIYSLIDNLILMKKGNIVYQGNCENAEAYFAQAGYPCPPKCNPADHLIDVLCIGSNDTSVDAANVSKMVLPLDMDFGVDKEGFAIKAAQPWHMQFFYLFSRNVKEKSRLYDVFLLNIAVSVITSLFIGYSAWHRIGYSGDSVAKRNAIIFFTVIHQGVVSSLQGTFAFPMERALMLRERSAGTYQVSAYFTAKFIVESFFQLPPPVIFSIMVYPLCQLQENWRKFFIFLAFQILCNMAATSLANLMSCLCGSIDLASVALVLAMEITRLYSGFFISPKLLSTSDSVASFRFADALSYMKYVYVGLCINEYSDLTLHCEPSDAAADYNDPKTRLSCKYTKGEQLMALYGYDQFTLDYLFGILIVFIVGCRIFSYLGLRFYKG
jgi:ATP-binding cassette subfamily G (WHITE) protein 2